MKQLKKIIESKVKIRFPDCDPFNHLNNSKYIDYFINAREDQLIGNTGNPDPYSPFIFTFKLAWRKWGKTRGFSTIALIIVIALSCNSQDCSKLPETFRSYTQAISLVKSSTFKIKEGANTSDSSWITSAKYYSCDGITGYFIYTTIKNREYIHKGIPVNVWEDFKNSSSKGSFYDYNIKNRYPLKLN